MKAKKKVQYGGHNYGRGLLERKFVDKNVYELACERARYCFENYSRVSVMFSGGKDSTVALNVVLQVAKEVGYGPVDVIFWDEEAISFETEHYMRRVAARDDVVLHWFCLPVKHRNASSKKKPWWHCWAEEDREKWCRPLPPEAITVDHVEGFKRLPIPEQDAWTVDYLRRKDARWASGAHIKVTGIRAQESLRRLRSVTNRETLNWIVSSQLDRLVGMNRAMIVYDWMAEDVWTAMRTFGWDYNASYDHQRLAGIPTAGQRVCPPFGEEPLEGLWMYAVCYPELWEKMVNRVPGANMGAMYGRSPLMGARGVKLDPARDPLTQVREACEQWNEPERSHLLKRVAALIRQHTRDTGKPVPIDSDGTAVASWTFLFQIATRGDLKNRKKLAQRQPK